MQKLFTYKYMWLHFDMIVNHIKDVIIESSSHAAMVKVLTLVFSWLGVGRRVVSLRWIVSALTAGPTAMVLVRIRVLSSPLLTSTASLVTLVTIVGLVLGVSPLTLVGTI